MHIVVFKFTSNSIASSRYEKTTTIFFAIFKFAFICATIGLAIFTPTMYFVFFPSTIIFVTVGIG